jgi:DNA-binding transcriptional regulator YdaS (Cro superfamily)
MTFKPADPRAAIVAFVERCGGQKAASVQLGCSPQFVSGMVLGRKSVPATMFEKLGLRVVSVKS